jgi:hypothetical protein
LPAEFTCETRRSQTIQPRKATNKAINHFSLDNHTKNNKKSDLFIFFEKNQKKTLLS